MNLNSENPKIGKDFELIVKNWFEQEYNQPFELQKNIKIGFPPKNHCFDISDKTGSLVIECKCYTWTDTGNVPAAKLACLNEAVLYLSFLPKDTKKCIVMPKSIHNKHNETLAEYYYRRYSHLLNDIEIMEFDKNTSAMRLINDTPANL